MADKFDIDIGGVAVPIVKGNLSDADWKQAKLAAKKPAEALMADVPEAPVVAAAPPLPVEPPPMVPPVMQNDQMMAQTGVAPVVPAPPSGLPSGTPIVDNQVGLMPPPPPEQQASQGMVEAPAQVVVAPRQPAPAAVSRQAEDGFKAEQDAIRAKGDLESEALRTQSRLFEEKQQQLLEQQAAAQASTLRKQQDMTSRLAAYDKSMAEATTPAKIDPERWWNSRTTTQKIFAAIAQALSKGGTGFIENAVNQDLAAQRSDIENKMAAGKNKAAMQYNGIQIARQNGLDEFEQEKFARGFSLDMIENQFKQAAANSGSELVKANAAQAIAQVQQLKAKNDQARAQWYTQQADEREANRQKMQLEMMKMGAAQAASKAAPVGRPLTEGQTTAIADLKTSLSTAERYSKEFKEKASGLVDKIAGMDPIGLVKTDASEYNTKREVAVQLIGKALEGGVLKEPDIVRYQGMIPAAGDRYGETKWDALIKELKGSIESKLKTAKEAGYDVSGISPAGTPESQSDLIRKLGMK